MFLVAAFAMFGTLMILAAIVQRRKNGSESDDLQTRDDVRFDFVRGRPISHEQSGAERYLRD